jgi:Family of unknown function (DUF6173)
MRSQYKKTTTSDIPDSVSSIIAAQERTIEERSGYANVMYRCLLQEIKEFESELKSDEEIGAYFASFAGATCLHIESIKHRDPYYLILTGVTEQGQKVRLIQHVTQTSILFVPVKVNPEEDRKPRRFGFDI